MRMMMKASIPVEAGNLRVTDGTLPKTIQAILGDLKPEAAYFADDNGKRTAFLFFDMQDPSQIPRVAEPWFLSLGASIELHPVMTVDDLTKAAPHFQEVVRKYATVSTNR